MQYLGTYALKDVGKRTIELMGMYSIKGDNSHIKIADNLVNRIIMGEDTDCVTKSPIVFEELKFKDGLYDYQIEDVLKIVNSRGFLNRNKPGWGKTVEAVVAARNLDAKSILVVAPNPTLYQWEVHFRTWWPDRANDIEYVKIGGELHKGKIMITNPEKIVSQKMRQKFRYFHFDVLIVDEAHILKNRTAQRTQIIKEIPATYRWAFTGTPILKNPDDLWSIYDFLNPRYLGVSYWNFVRYFCNVEMTYFGEQIRGLTSNPQHVSLLGDILERTSCYHKTRNLSCGKTVITVPLEMDKKQAALYKRVKKLVFEELPEDLTIANGAVLVTRLLQVTSAPSMFEESINGIKFNWILQFLENNPTEKIVVYSRYERVLKHFEQFLTKKKIQSVSYTGKIKQNIRQQNIEQFQEDENCRVMLGTIGALGVGVDGLQKASHICVFIDKDFSPEINRQCEDRLYRIGQTEEVICYYLDCKVLGW